MEEEREKENERKKKKKNVTQKYIKQWTSALAGWVNIYKTFSRSFECTSGKNKRTEIQDHVRML